MRLTATFIALAAFGAAAVLAVMTASLAAGAIETRAVRLTERLLAAQGLPWAQARADGLTLTLTGTAPTEALRFRAVSLAGTVVGGDRVIDALEVTPAASNAPPAFLLELLRNDDGVSLIGLVPGDWDAAALRAAAGRAAADAPVADMLQTTTHPVPRHWDEAVRFGLDALALLPRSKISIRPGAVTVTAIAESVAEQRQFETALARAAPRGDAALALRIDIAAPRPVITPFTLRFVMDEAGARFDACAAVSERGRARIVAAAVAAGVSGKIDCALGLGAPSPRWAEGAEAAISALARLGAGSVTLSDTDVTLIAAHTVTAAAFDRAVGDLGAALPDVFSLKATRLEPPQAAREAPAAQFTAVRGPDGTVALRGRIADERLQAVTDAYARARFGADAVTTALRVDPDGLPPGWSLRVLAGLAALAVLHEGSVLVEADSVQVQGRTGMRGATAEIARVLADQLGQGAQYSVDVTYDATLDPAAGRPAPEACVAAANAVLAAGKITFAPGSAEIDGSARRTLEDLARVLQSCPDAPIEIGGHTDSQGRAETNLALSERRAEAVRNALRALRVPVASITARGYGAEEPIADNATEDGRETNRRIAFRLLVPDADAVADGPASLSAADDPAGAGAFRPAGADDADSDPVAAEDTDADPAAGAGAPAAAPIIAGVLATPAGEAGAAQDAAAVGADPAAASFAPQAATLRPQRRPADRTAP